MEEKEFIIYQNKKGNIVYSILAFILAIIAILSLGVNYKHLNDNEISYRLFYYPDRKW